MGRTRDVSKILTSNTSILTLASASSVYQTIATTGLVDITPSTISVSGGSGSVSTTGAVSFTSASAISFNNVFSATYQNYKVIGNFTATTGNSNSCRLRVSDTDNTASSYVRQVVAADSASLVASTLTTTFFDGFWMGSTHPSCLEASFYSPFESIRTNVLTRSTQEGTTYKQIGASHNVASSFTGFTLIAASGTFSGTVRIYGFNN
jgi:hypothetical protein